MANNGKQQGAVLLIVLILFTAISLFSFDAVRLWSVTVKLSGYNQQSVRIEQLGKSIINKVLTRAHHRLIDEFTNAESAGLNPSSGYQIVYCLTQTAYTESPCTEESIYDDLNISSRVRIIWIADHTTWDEFTITSEVKHNNMIKKQIQKVAIQWQDATKQQIAKLIPLQWYKVNNYVE